MPLDPRSPVVISSADPSWQLQFTRLADVLAEAVGDLPVSIEHVGSTAVPGLDAKPILDVAILARDQPALISVRKRLRNIGYQSEGDRGIPGRESLRRTSAAVPQNGSGPWMDHHLYLALDSSEYADVQCRFRDYLRNHPDAASRYAKLKHALAAAYANDRDEFTERKGPFVRAVLAAETAEREAAHGVAPGASAQIAHDVFAAVDLRVGTVVSARLPGGARRPAIVMEIDFGPLGLLKSSAQITDRYSPEALLGRQVVAVVNLPPRQIGKLMSRCLVLGAVAPDAVVLLSSDAPVANGTRVM